MIKCDRCNKQINDDEIEYLGEFKLCKCCHEEVIRFITEGRYYGLD
jgi:hypothetical protein